MWFNTVTTFEKFMGNGLITIFYLAVVVYLFFEEKRKPFRIMFVYTPILLLIIYFNPVFAGFFYDAVGEEIYYRILWLLPMSVEIGYGIVTIAAKLQAGKRRMFLALCVVLIATGGSMIYKNVFYEKADNIYHMPQEVVDICDDIRVEGRELMVAMPMEFVNFVRQYDATICMPYGREAAYYYNDFSELLAQDEIPMEEAIEKARACGCHYMILADSKTVLGDYEAMGYEYYKTIDGYKIFKDTTMYFGF